MFSDGLSDGRGLQHAHARSEVGQVGTDSRTPSRPIGGSMPSFGRPPPATHRPLARCRKSPRPFSPTTRAGSLFLLQTHTYTLDGIVDTFAVVSRKEQHVHSNISGIRGYALSETLSVRWHLISSRHRRERARPALRCIDGTHTHTTIRGHQLSLIKRRTHGLGSCGNTPPRLATSGHTSDFTIA